MANIISACRSLLGPTTSSFYKDRLDILKRIDSFYKTHVFGDDCLGSHLNDRNMEGASPQALSNLNYDEIENLLYSNPCLVPIYIYQLGISFSSLLKAGVKYPSIYMSKLSEHTPSPAHEIYYKNLVSLNPDRQPIPSEYENKILSFVIAIKNRSKRTNIAIQSIKYASGDYFKNVEIIIVEDYSDDPFINNTFVEIDHLITGHYNRSCEWNKSILLNEGIRFASARYVVMADCDFIYSDLRQLIEIVYHNTCDDKTVYCLPLHETHVSQFTQGQKEINRNQFYPYSYVWIYNKNSALEINGFNEDFNGWGYEETDIIRRLLSCSSKLAFLENAHAYHFTHSDSSRSRNDNNKRLFDMNILKPDNKKVIAFDSLNSKTKSLLATYNKYKGGEIDILGNGPTAKNYDFKEDAIKIGFNAAYRYWDIIDSYPEIYVCMDKVVCAYHAAEIKRLIDSKRISFFILDDAFTSIYPEYKEAPSVMAYSDFNASFKIFATKHITTGSFGARLAILLGFRKINIWGMSGNYINFLEESERVALQDTGLPIKSIFTSSNVSDFVLRITKTPARNPNYFFDSYQQVGDLYNVPSRSKQYKCDCDFHGGATVLESIHKYWIDLLYHDLAKLDIRIDLCRDSR